MLTYFISLKNWLDFIAQMGIHKLGYRQKLLRMLLGAPSVSVSLQGPLRILSFPYLGVYSPFLLSVAHTEGLCCWRLTCAEVSAYHLQKVCAQRRCSVARFSEDALLLSTMRYNFIEFADAVNTSLTITA